MMGKQIAQYDFTPLATVGPVHLLFASFSYCCLFLRTNDLQSTWLELISYWFQMLQSGRNLPVAKMDLMIICTFFRR